jgi:hypothetical protein
MNESEVFVVLVACGFSLPAGLEFFRRLRCSRRFTAMTQPSVRDANAVNAETILSGI